MSQMNLPAHHPLAFGYNPFGGYPTAATMAALQSPFAGPIPADPDSSSGRSSSSNADTSTVAAHIPAFVGPTTAETTMLAAQEHQQVDIQLANAELWQKFHRLQNEMVVTRPGRKMFPKLELHLHGLDPKSQYTLFLYMQKIDNYRYKYQAGGWSTAGQEDSNGLQLSNRVQHHEGWNSGEFWASQERVVFERVKLTNKEIQQGGNSLISLCSMQKYQPVVLLFRSQGAASVLIQEFRPAECQFIAVTAYQSDAVTKLKVEHNPFAKGFREGSSRKRTLSPMPGMTVSFHSSLPQHFLAAAASNCHPPPAKRSLLGSPAASLPTPFQFPVYGGGHFGASFPPAAAAWFSNPTAQLTAMASQIVAAEPPATAQPPMAIDPLNFLTLYNNFFQMMTGQQQVAKKEEEEEQAQKTP